MSRKGATEFDEVCRPLAGAFSHHAWPGDHGFTPVASGVSPLRGSAKRLRPIPIARPPPERSDGPTPAANCLFTDPQLSRMIKLRALRDGLLHAGRPNNGSSFDLSMSRVRSSRDFFRRCRSGSSGAGRFARCRSRIDGGGRLRFSAGRVAAIRMELAQVSKRRTGWAVSDGAGLLDAADRIPRRRHADAAHEHASDLHARQLRHWPRAARFSDPRELGHHLQELRDYQKNPFGQGREKGERFRVVFRLLRNGMRSPKRVAPTESLAARRRYSAVGTRELAGAAERSPCAPAARREANRLSRWQRGEPDSRQLC